jgi:hypothetical protein
VVANYYNDTISICQGGLGNWVMSGEIDLRPGKNDPPSRACRGASIRIGWRSRKIDVVKLVGAPGIAGLPGQPVIAARIAVKGQPKGIPG